MDKSGLQLSYYSVSKDEHVDIEDMAHEHLVNVLYKLLKDKNYSCLLYTSPSPRD